MTLQKRNLYVFRSVMTAFFMDGDAYLVVLCALDAARRLNDQNPVNADEAILKKLQVAA